MRKAIGALVLAVVLAAGILCGAGAEVFLNKEKPADWEERDLLKITAMDFVQNDAFILQCGGESMIIDGGSKKYWKTMMDYLESLGLSHVNILFNTHPHDDHLEAQIQMVKSGRLTADRFVSPFFIDYGVGYDKVKYQREMVKVLEDKGIPFVQILPDEELTLGGARMVLYRYPDGKDANQLSGVLWLHYGDATILLPGDLTGDGERWLVNHYGAEGLKSDILKSPHHGIVRMVPEFLEAVDPALTVITNRRDSNQKAQLDARKYANIWTSMGKVFMETDGKDWYVTQVKNP
ncbi:hypothetical protein JNO48_08820 [Clostridiales bacterium]|nr:hypothetical protein JNO48_08820 [Clostridiales bacterium]